jgi:hypothetical protein
MIMKKTFFLSLIAIFLFAIDASAGKRYWISGTAASWNNTSNWSTSSGGASGASVPGSSDTAYYDGSGTGNCTLDVNINIKYLNMISGYTGTIVQGTSTVTIGTTGGLLSAGTFSGGSGTITLSGAFTISGTAFTSTSGVFSTNSNFTLSSGSFVHNSGTMKFTASNTIAGSITFFHLLFSPTSQASYSVSNTITADGIMTVEGSSKVTLDNGTINADSNVVVTNSSTSATAGGTATIVFTSNFAQSFTGSGTAGTGKLPNITINKTGGTLSLLSIISVNGNWTYTAGTVSPGISGVAFYGTFNLDGQGSSSTMSFYRVQISGNTRTLTGNLDCNDNLSILSSTTLSAGSYTINVGGNFLNQGTWTYGTSTVVFDGTNFNRIQQTSGTITFANVVFNRTAGKSVTLLNKVYVTTNATFTCGRVKTTTTNVLEFADNATCTMSNNDSAYVHGPVLKTGNDGFIFPLGDTTLHDSIAYHPLTMSAPSSATDQFRSTYYATGQSLGSATVDSLTGLSTSEYWTLERITGSSAVTAGLSWNRNSPPSSVSDLRVAAWNSTASAWADLGKAEVTMSWPTGRFMASATTVFNSNVATLAPAMSLQKYKGYATVKRKLDGGFYEVKGSALYFRFDDEYNDQNHNLDYRIYNSANTDVAPTLVPTTNNAALSVYGDNRFKIDLYTSSAILSAGYYILEVRNEKNEPFYLRFKMN